MTYEEYQKKDHSALLAKGQAIYREKSARWCIRSIRARW